jgi:hypothetical protein
MNKIKSAILITGYNRYDYIKNLLKLTIKTKRKIYISIDGPKNIKDINIQKKITNLIISQKNSKIKYKVLNKNYGCQKAVLLALKWFFSIERQGIILEDDLVPSKFFFAFCEKMLIKYKNNQNIFSISGFSPLNLENKKQSYFFSKYFMCWGWATWRDRWLVARKFLLKKDNNWLKLLDREEWKNSKLNQLEEKYFKIIYKKIIAKEIDSWAFLWLLIGVSNCSKFLIPYKSLVKNIGTSIFGANNVPSRIKKNKKLTYYIKKKLLFQNSNKELDEILFNVAYNPKKFFYPYRATFLLKTLFFDPKFFFIKFFLIFKNKVKNFYCIRC